MVHRPAEAVWGGPDEDLPSYFDAPVAVAIRPEPGPPRPPAPHRPAGPVGQPMAGVLPAEPLLAERGRALLVIFPRAVDLPFERSMAALERWWREEGHDGVMVVGRSWLRGPPGLDPGQSRCRLEVRLRRGRCGRGVRMELEAAPWFGSFGTRLGLHPKRSVRPSRRYFRAGHDLMDAVTQALFAHAAG